MNPMTEVSAKHYTKTVKGKPNPPVSEAVLSKLSTKSLEGIDPSKTPVKAYVKSI